MRILRVAQTCYPDVTGGGAYHVHAMSRDQAALGHDVTVLTVRREPDQPLLEERAGYTVLRFDRTAALLGNDLSAGLARYLHRTTGAAGGRSPHFDVVHAHSHLYASTTLAALERWLGDTVLRSETPWERVPLWSTGASSRKAAPLAITNHGLYSQTAPEWLFDRFLRTVGRWTFEQADVVFCYTDVDRRRLRSLGVATDVEVVPNGVDTERFSPTGPEHERIAGGRTGGSDAPLAGDAAVLFVGRLVDGKRPRDAIEAMAQVREAVPGATLFVCGDGPLRADLEARASELLDAAEPRTGSDDRDAGAVFLGHLDYDEMPRVYRAADVLVLPSRAEGMPRTVLEARASGTPVVASDLEHVQSLDDDGVRAVPVGDVGAIADAIVEVLAGAHAETPRPATPDRASIADGGDQEAALDGGADSAAVELSNRSVHDWAETVRRTTDALSDLCEGTRPR